MAASASPSPDDPETLKALLAEERAENERLRQIIKAMQRHRFGRRAESLPEDQLLLGLEEAEQVEAAGHARSSMMLGAGPNLTPLTSITNILRDDHPTSSGQVFSAPVTSSRFR